MLTQINTIVKKPDLKLVKIGNELREFIKGLDHRLLGEWAKDIALKTINLFEEKYPQDDVLRKGIEALDLWLNGQMRMSEVRKVVYMTILPAARKAREEGNYAAEAAARSAGHAVATAHVPSHSLGACIYSLTAIKRNLFLKAEDYQEEIENEYQWQIEHLKELLNRK